MHNYVCKVIKKNDTEFLSIVAQNWEIFYISKLFLFETRTRPKISLKNFGQVAVWKHYGTISI